MLYEVEWRPFGSIRYFVEAESPHQIIMVLPSLGQNGWWHISPIKVMGLDVAASDIREKKQESNR